MRRREEEHDALRDDLVRLYPRLRAFAAVVAPSDISADDAVQQALVALLQSGRISEVVDLSAYLRRAIVNQVSNDARRLGRRRAAWIQLRSQTQQTHYDVYPSDTPELESLQPVARAVLYLRLVDGHSFDEIAEMLRIRPATARQIASRSLQLLRGKALP